MSTDNIRIEQPDGTILFSQHVCNEIAAARWETTRDGQSIVSLNRSKITIGDKDWDTTFSLFARKTGWPWKRRVEAFLQRGGIYLRLENAEQILLYDAYMLAIYQIRKQSWDRESAEAIHAERQRWWP